MNVLYIGGTGRISLACVRASVEAGQKVTVFNRGRGDEPLPADVEQIAGDLSDPADCRELGRRNWDVVCQFLAYAPERIRADRELFAGRCGQYVFISSASAYRKPPTTWRITEDVPLANPYWPYSQAKADLEAELMAWHAEGVLPVTIVRPSHTNRNNFPGTFLRGGDLAWRLANGRPIISHGDGTNLWVLTHSEDFARPFVRLLGNERALGEAFHITADWAHTWDEIFAAMAESLAVRANLVHVPTETLVRYRPDWAGPLLGDKAWSTTFDNSKVKAVAGDFPCARSLADQMRDGAAAWQKVRPAYRPDPVLHALVDRIAAEQQALGT